MTGRVAIVTGANTGIGYQVARYLAEGGNDVVMACRSIEKGKEAMNRIKAEYPNSLVQVMEVSSNTVWCVMKCYGCLVLALYCALNDSY